MVPCLFGLFWPPFGIWQKKEEEERTFTITRPVGFAAGKNSIGESERERERQSKNLWQQSPNQSHLLSISAAGTFVSVPCKLTLLREELWFLNSFFFSPTHALPWDVTSFVRFLPSFNGAPRWSIQGTFLAFTPRGIPCPLGFPLSTLPLQLDWTPGHRTPETDTLGRPPKVARYERIPEERASEARHVRKARHSTGRSLWQNGRLNV